MVALLYVTAMPEQTGFADAVIVILTGRFGLTVMVIWFEVAGFPAGQIAFEVRMQDTRSPDAGLYEYVDEFVPTLSPLTFHW
jgi:hypothetical protein